MDGLNSQDLRILAEFVRGQLTAYLRLWGDALYSTYGPTADTGGLAKNGARVVYRYESVQELLDAETDGGRTPTLLGVGPSPVTERPPDAGNEG